jgi:hypothetical protein
MSRFTLAGISLKRPSIFSGLFFLFHCTIVFLSFWALGDALDKGEIKNEPELLRRLYFGGFSLALCLRLCLDFGFWQNSWSNRVTAFVGAYLPIGWFGAYLIGILRY